MCQTQSATSHHFDPIAGVRHYPCVLDCPAVQEQLAPIRSLLPELHHLHEVITEVPGDPAYHHIRLCAGDEPLWDLGERGPVVPPGTRLSQRLHPATAEALDEVFGRIEDLSLTCVTLVEPDQEAVLIEVFDLAVSECEGGDDEDL